MKHIDDILPQNQHHPYDNGREYDEGPTPPLEQEWLCPVCGGTGYLRLDVPVGHPNFGKIVPCECRIQERERKQTQQLRSIGNLDALVHYTFESFLPDGFGLSDKQQHSLRVAYQNARHFAEKPRGWLVLLGGYGCGKTHLSAAIANYLVNRGKTAIFVVVPDLLDHLRATYSPYSTVSYDQRFEDIRNASVLILDDLGTENATEWAREKLLQIFNYRYNARLPTVISSNYNLEDFDERLRSRVADYNFTQVCTILAHDFRGSGVIQQGSELSSLPLHSDQTFETFNLRQNELDRDAAENLKRTFETAQRYAQEPHNWIAISGVYGCGKTHLAAAIANERHNKHGETPLFVVVPDLLDHLRATYNPNSRTPYDKLFEEVRKAPLLVLDDLGTESATPWAREKMYQLFNYRYAARLPTVLTMAKDANLDPRLKSLVLDVSRCNTVEIIAPSYRGRPDKSRPQQNNTRPPRNRPGL